MRNYCSNCGAQLSINTGFCPNCGHKINNVEGSASVENRKAANNNRFFDRYDFDRRKQKKTRKFSFFGFFIWIVALFIIAYLIYYYAMPIDNKDQDGDITTALLAKKKKQNQDSNFLKIPEKLAVEQQRTVKNDSILVLHFRTSGIPLKDEYSLIKNLFPEAEIEHGDASEKFTAYNVKENEMHYNIIATYGEFQGGFVIDKLYFSTGKFNTDNIGDIFF